MTIEELNSIPAARLRDILLECCGSTAWAARMALKRPFRSASELLSAADEVWWALGDEDWLEAFSGHPQIGDRKNIGKWSSEEQRGMDNAATETAKAMQELNRIYKQKFGWIFVVCATGKTAEEMRELLKQRLANNRVDEIRIAAGEQAKIARLRLEKLLRV